MSRATSEIIEPKTGKDQPPENTTPSKPPFLLLSKTTLAQESLVILMLGVFLFLFRLQACLSIDSVYLGGARADAGLYIWLSRFIAENFISFPWFETTAFYPYSRTLAWSDNFILPSLIIWGGTALGAPHTLAYNLTLLGAELLAGYFTYLVAFRLSGSTLASLVSGVAFMLSGYFTAQLGHPQLQFTLWLPLGLLALTQFISSPTLLWAVAFGAVVFGAFLTTVYYALFLAVLAPLFFFALWLLRPAAVNRKLLLQFGMGSFFGLLPVLPFVLPYLDVKDAFGSRGLYESYAFAASGSSLFTTGPLHWIYSFTHDWSHAEAAVFPGFVLYILGLLSLLRLFEAKKLRKLGYSVLALLGATLLFSERNLFQLILADSRIDVQIGHILATLCAWALLILFGKLLRQMGQLEKKLGFENVTNRAVIGSLCFLALCFLCLSLGPLGNPEKGDISFSPFTLFYTVVPGFDSMRAVSRMLVVSLLCLCLLIPFSLPLFRLYKKGPAAVCLATLALFLIENGYTHYPLERAPEISPIIQNLSGKELNESDIIVFLPFTSELKGNETVKSWGEFAARNTEYMLATLETGASTINGYSGQRSAIMTKFPRKFSEFPDNRSLSTLSLIPGVKYIIVDTAAMPNTTIDQLLARASRFSNALKFIVNDAKGRALFEYLPHTVMRDSFYLRVPSYPAGVLDMELQALYSSDGKEILLSLLEEDHFSGESIATFPIPADGSTELYSIRLPEPTKRALPYRIRFSVDKGHKVILTTRRHVYVKEE